MAQDVMTGRTGASLATSAEDVDGLGVDVPATLAWVARLAPSLPLPGQGATADLWGALADAAALDVGAARILEPHADALAILDQAAASGMDTADLRRTLRVDSRSTWGVFAAEGPGTRLVAERREHGAWELSGTKPWCSLAAHLSHALVTAWVGPEQRRLFAVDLRDDGVSARPGPWVSRGLHQVVSAPVDFAHAFAVPVGAPGWYQRRPGFAWGGIGVAAIWWGGARPLADALAAAAASERADQLAQAYAGAADAALWGAGTALAEAAALVDAGELDDAGARLLAARVRAVVSDAVERVLDLSDRALGPGPLTADEEHARRVADLRVYVRQHHAERDLARLGSMVRSS
ncbi:acyl-CoA dehydrogenase [Microbacterium saccharophilum]|nr:acyl-CoA dehydrogenase family protein [Microbacterium saccharophilum]GEP48111.1 acyl-CoA dehydrogenase [Microbacterium saccharophilum]